MRASGPQSSPYLSRPWRSLKLLKEELERESTGRGEDGVLAAVEELEDLGGDE